VPRVDPKQLAQAGATANQVLAWDNATSKWAPKTETVSFLGFGANGVATTTTTRYLFPWYSDTQAPTTAPQMRIPRACTLRNLRIRHNTGAGNGNNIVYTVRKNGVATALTCTLASTANDGSDLVNTVAFAAGDLIDIEVTKGTAIGTSPTFVVGSLEAVA
jgi:hypothetical protein